jgi:hypothetical protein
MGRARRAPYGLAATWSWTTEQSKASAICKCSILAARQKNQGLVRFDLLVPANSRDCVAKRQERVEGHVAPTGLTDAFVSALTHPYNPFWAKPVLGLTSSAWLIQSTLQAIGFS